MLNLTAQNHPDKLGDLSPQITVIGVGGAGCNAVNNMIVSKVEGVRFVACNTDAQALKHSLAPTKVHLGTSITSGLGAGSKPDVGRAAAEESIDDVIAQLEGVHMVFVTAGMGGGTGTGAAPVIARAAKEAGILTVGVVTKPFQFEGAHRMRLAEEGLREMQEYVDTLIVIPNQNLFRIANEKTTFADAFKMADSVLQSGVRGVTDLMVMPGLINLDFADVRTAMMEMGKAMMGTGEAVGERKAVEAAERAINNPLLDDISMRGAKGVIINITGGSDMTLFDVDEACNRIRDEVDADANIIFGSTFDEGLDGMMRVTVLATGIDTEADRRGGRPVRTTNTSVGARSGGVATAQHSQSAHQSSHAQPQQPQSHAAPQSGAQSGTQGVEGVYGSLSARSSHQLYVPPTGRVSAPEVSQQPVYVQEGATMRKIETGGSDYQQAELSINTLPAHGGVDASAESQARGVRYGGAFIPPRPVEQPRGFAATEAVGQPEYAPTDYAFDDGVSFDARPAYAAAPARTAAAQNLMPPVVGAKKRQPSLFEKIAGMFTESDDEELGASDGGQGSASAGGMFASFTSRRSAVPQSSAPVNAGQGAAHQGGAHGVSSPYVPAAPAGHASGHASGQGPSQAYQPAPQQAQSQYAQAPQAQAQPTPAQQQVQADLDIPAFLRRQVS